MANMSDSTFIDTVSVLRKNRSLEEFRSEVSQISQFTTMVDIINDNTMKWANLCGLIGEKNKVDEYNLSPQELLWSRYFKDHSFSSTEDQRNLSDALAILTGIDVNRFIRVIYSGKDSYPAFIVIVPTSGSGGHNYGIGDPVISFGIGVTFYRKSGESGNRMSTDLKSIRLPSRGEIEDIVICILFRLSGGAEHMVSNLLEN